MVFFHLPWGGAYWRLRLDGFNFIFYPTRGFFLYIKRWEFFASRGKGKDGNNI
jgi:hypothetical protein